jgi:asparagine synthase (glutamine-hydrolysing)
MCGIAGYLTSAGAPLPREPLRAMCSRLVHRGPDGYGEYFDQDAALGHRRLSIIDVAGGAQPLANEDGAIQVVFNGEIYNHRELARDLESRGHRFRTRSDTEVLVHLYEEEGERMPAKLNGMFAFAIWDAARKRLFLARDRFGEKPLYYTSSLPGLRFAFASELKALMTVPGFRKRVDARAVAEFVGNAYIADPSTIYRNVHRLCAGHSLTVAQSGITTRRYWAPPFSAEPGHRKAAAERLQELARDAVRIRTMSEVPLGAFLSGGIDSSAVVASLAADSTEPVQTFSIGFTSPEFDELDYARLVARRYGTLHRELILDGQVHEMLGRLAGHYDEPFGDPSAIPTLYLARFARERVTVVLSGDGADEVFGGYLRYGRVLERLKQTARPSIGDEYQREVAAISDANLTSLLSPHVHASLDGYWPRDAMKSRFERFRGLPPLLQMQAVDMETYLPSDILVKMDRATMAYSLESRAPWLDHRLAEFAGRFQPDWKFRGVKGKRMLKHAFRRLLPPKILMRPKMGFAAPLAEWFRTSLRTTFEDLVLCREMSAFLNLEQARRLWREHQSGMHDDHSWVLWNLLVLGQWRQRHSPDA